jgi:PPK2 family polyphosphate:nucleotide phosphotransferase
MKSAKIAKRFRIDDPKHFRLKDYDPADTQGLDIGKDEAKAMLAADIERVSDMQEKLYAQDRWAVLIVLQGMDAAGKDSVIKHVMSGINPLGCEVHAFKQPSTEELDHDFLWRAASRLPRRGRIGIFNRSYYEEVLVVRVHRELLQRQRLPPQLIDEDIWEQRFRDIHGFERHLRNNGVAVLKFHLRISPEEQKRRFLERIETPAKRWKFSMNDVAERKLWDRYMDAYEDMIRNTSTNHCPWYVVPADHKWFARLVVAAALIEELERLDLKFPRVTGAALDELRRAEAALRAEKD